MTSTLIILDTDQALPLTRQGLDLLKELSISFQLRLVSSLHDPERVQGLLHEFEQGGGKVVISFAAFVAHIPLLAMSDLPILTACHAVSENFNTEQASSSYLLAIAQFGFGASGFSAACSFSARMLASQDKELPGKLKVVRSRHAARLIEIDAKYASRYP